jgi:phosphoribosylformylglycinamidine synthase
VKVELEESLPAVPLFFGEAQGRIIVSCQGDTCDDMFKTAQSHGVPCREIGTVTAAAEGFNITAADAFLSVDVATLNDVHDGTIPRIMEAPAQG